jgi:hypothetical protein
VQLTAPVPDLKLANRELGTVEGIGQDGRMSLKMDGGREVELDSVKNPHLDHGYAVTSHSSQGQTADRVLIHADTELGAKDLLNNRMAYVAVSRGAYDAQIFTNDREKLGAALGHDVSHSSAHAPESQASTSSSSSTRLADDTYTPSTLSLIGQSFSASSKTSSSSTASATSSSQGSQGDTVTLASLIKNQTISGSVDVAQTLWSAVSSLMSVDPEATAWNDLTDKVNSGDYSGAQTALADYSTALVNSHIGTWADISPIQNDLTALGSALKTGNASDVQTAFTSLSAIAPTHNLGLVLPTAGGSDVASESGQMSWFATNLASALQTLGYTAGNATAEANTLVLGYAADLSTIHVVTQGAPSDDISDQSAAEQSITDLGKATAQSTDTNLLSNIIASMSQANSATAMESTLTQLDSQYGTAAQGTGVDSVGQASVSAYA